MFVKGKTMRLISTAGAITLCALLPAMPAAAADKGAHHPVLLISIDGLAPDKVLRAEAHDLKVPVLRRFLKEGSYANEVVNVNPTVTNPNHTTLVTGVLPAEHGIYNNRPFAVSAKLPKSYSAYSQIKAPTLWRAAKAAGLSTASMFWPVTGGATDIDFDLHDGSDEDDGKIVNDAIHLIRDKRPDLFTIHIVSLDHEEHKSGPNSPASRRKLEEIDAAVGRIIAAERKTRPDAIVAVVSDHGFAPIAHQTNLNAALVEAGFITLSANAEPRIASWQAFAWYVGGSAMIVLKDPKDRQASLRLEASLAALAADPAHGIESIHKRNEIAGMGYAPNVDYVVAFKSGWRMGNALSGPVTQPAEGGGHGAYSAADLRTDMHSAFFISGPGVEAARNLGRIDIRQIAPTIAGLLGAALPSATAAPLQIHAEAGVNK